MAQVTHNLPLTKTLERSPLRRGIDWLLGNSQSPTVTAQDQCVIAFERAARLTEQAFRPRHFDRPFALRKPRLKMVLGKWHCSYGMWFNLVNPQVGWGATPEEAWMRFRDYSYNDQWTDYKRDWTPMPRTDGAAR